MKGSRTRRPATRKSDATTILPILVLLVTGIAVYWNSLEGPFIWDDQTSIVTNPTIQRLWPLSVPLTPPRETPVAGRPVVNLSFALNYAYGELHETGYHAGNIAVHIACASVIMPGPDDYPLYYDSTNTSVLAGVATIDTTPPGRTSSQSACGAGLRM